MNRRLLTACIGGLTTIFLTACLAAPLAGESVGYTNRLWTTVAELQAMSLKPLEIARLRKWSSSVQSPQLFRRNEDQDVRLLSATYLSFIEQDIARQNQLKAICRAAIGSEVGAPDGFGDAESLALSRNLPAVLIACRLLAMHTDAGFRLWVKQLDEQLLGGQQRSLRSTHEQRANNWGTHAGAARAARAVFLNDKQALAEVAKVFAQWTGQLSGPTLFKFKRDTSWQANPRKPLGINPAGSSRDGHSLDGVLPADQRRGGSYQWPPPQEPYVWEALQGAVVTAQILHDNGYPAWEWGDKALLRAVRWLIDEAQFPAEGDDVWILQLIDLNYGTSFSTPYLLRPSKPGKNMGFTRFTHSAKIVDSTQR